MRADLLLLNGKCLAFDGCIYDWLAVKKDRILAMGQGDSYKSELAGWEEFIDADGGSILPGFYDSNTHLVQTAINAQWLDLSRATSFAHIGSLIREERRRHPDGLIAGYGLDELKLAEKTLPDRHVLDSFCGDAPVWLSRVEYHTSILNTYGLLYYKIPYTLEGVDLDKKKMPTGIFRQSANARLRDAILSDMTNAYRLKAINELFPKVISKGVTTVNAMEGGYAFCDKDAEFIYANRDAFPIDVALFYQTTDVRKIKEMGLVRIGGSLFIDGAFGSRNAALREDYSDQPGNRGTLYYSQGDINDFVLECYENELQLAVHVIGERAIEQIIKAHRHAAAKTGITRLRHRLEHVELPRPEHIQAAGELGLIFSMQPAYEYTWGGRGGMYEKRLGPRYERTNPFPQILAEGVTVCGGSDSDVTPVDPILGIYSAVNHPVEKHRIDVISAIRMFTSSGAYAVFEESFKGALKKGYLADIVILDRDILGVPEGNILDVQVTHTIKSGNVLYSKE